MHFALFSRHYIKHSVRAAAVGEMPAGYADKMEPVIGSIPLLVVMLVLTIPVAVFECVWPRKRSGNKQRF